MAIMAKDDPRTLGMLKTTGGCDLEVVDSSYTTEEQ